MKSGLRFSLLILSGFVLLHFKANAQAIHFKLVERSADDPGGTITGITQDPSGFLWLSTQNGLYKYDGYHYTAYHFEALNANSPAFDDLLTVAADSKGNIWFAPNGKGLDKLDPATGRVTHFRHDDHDTNSVASDWVMTIFEDHEGSIWLGTSNGLDRFDAARKAFIHFHNKATDAESLSNNFVYTIYEDKQGTLWVGTGNPYQVGTENIGGLNKWNRSTGKFTRYLHDDKDPHSLINNFVQSIFEDSRGNFWVGTSGDGLHTMDRATGKFERHLFDSAHRNQPSRPPVRNYLSWAVDQTTFIKEDAKGRVWIGSLESGIHVYDPLSQKTVYFGSDSNSEEKLQDNQFWKAYQTRDGVLWISTLGAHLYKIVPRQNLLPHTLIGGGTGAFVEDEDHSLWIGTARGLLHQRDNGKPELFPLDKDSTSFNNYIEGMEIVDHDFWLGAMHGLYRFNPLTKSLTNYRHQDGNANTISSDSIAVLLKTDDNNLWIGTLQGLDRLDIRSGLVTHFRNNINTGSHEIYDIGSILPEKNQMLWLAAARFHKGLDRLDIHSGIFKRYLPKLVTYIIMRDAAGHLWAGTDAGLYKYDESKDDFLPFTDESGVLNRSQFAGGLQEDHAQNLWLFTTKGIVRLNKDRSHAVLYGKNQGVNSLNLTYAGLVRSNGNVLYSNTDGYFNFNPDFLLDTSNRPSVAISQFLLNNVDVQTVDSALLASALHETTGLNLSHDQNSFSFEFTNIDFISAHEDTRLLYKLEGHDVAWRKAAGDGTASYFDLPAGKYTFKVRAMNDAGLSAERAITLVIRPPWWKTAWAYGAAILLVSSLGIFLYRSRIKQLEKKQDAQMHVMVATQEGERKRISRDLHDDVGTKLSAVKLSLSSLHEKANQINNDEIRTLARRSEESISEVMQDVRRLLLNLSPTVLEEFGYTSAVEGLVNKINETTTIHFNLVIFGMKQPLPKDHELALYRITQELITNVLKHADASHVSLQIGQRDGKIILMMEDDGKGFDLNTHKDGYGLKNLAARTKLLQGNMIVDSKEGKGTSVLIEIPYHFSEA